MLVGAIFYLINYFSWKPIHRPVFVKTSMPLFPIIHTIFILYKSVILLSLLSVSSYYNLILTFLQIIDSSMKPTIGNESLHQDSNDNGVRIVNFATSKNLVLKSTMFPHRDIHKYTWTSPDGKTHNQIDHILIDRRWHLSILDVRSFRVADCDTNHYLVVAKVRERLAVSEQAAQKFDAERFNLGKLN